jgi:hypothetical protein
MINIFIPASKGNRIQPGTVHSEVDALLNSERHLGHTRGLGTAGVGGRERSRGGDSLQLFTMLTGE